MDGEVRYLVDQQALDINALEIDVQRQAIVSALERLAVEEAGGLTAAQAIVALRLVRRDDVVEVLTAQLAAAWERSRFLDDLGVLAWAVLATGDGVERLRVPL